MTTVAIFADAPRGNVGLPAFSGSLLSMETATTLYRSMLADVAVAVDASGGETLVNYRNDEGVPKDTDVEAELLEIVDEALETLDDVRFEVQVGSTYYGRVGNTITHLLEREGTDTAAVVEPTAPFLTRSIIDSAAMKLRSSDVVLGPTTDGRVYYAGFGEPIDFTDAFTAPAVETVTRRADEEGLSVDFLPMLPVIERPDDLRTSIPLLRSRGVADRTRPERTVRAVEETGLRVEAGPDGPQLTRSGSDRR